MKSQSFHSRAGLAGFGGTGLGDCACIAAPCNCEDLESRPAPAGDPFGNAMSGMKWLAIGVAALFFLIVLGSRR